MNTLVRTTLLILAFILNSFQAVAQDEQAKTSREVEVGILVLPTEKAAAAVLQQLRSGTDFSVLAKEKSIDSTAGDGGSMGMFDPAQLRPELGGALRGLHAGEYSGIVHIASGFAVLSRRRRSRS
jgi:foldase protein PrsA